MKAELKERWLTALKSGEYKQARKRLKNSRGGHCCLGVLACVATKEFNEAGASVEILKTLIRVNGEDQEIASYFLERLGVDDETATNLMKANDRHHSFKYVIPLIEAIPVTEEKVAA